MTERDLLKLIGETPEEDIMNALKTREKGNTVMKQEKAPGRKSGKYANPRGPMKAVLIAALIGAMVAAASAAVVHYRHGLIQDLEEHSLQNPEGYEQLLVTAPRTESGAAAAEISAESELTPLVSGRDDVAEYQVLEAILDSESLYLHERIVPLQENVILIDQLVMPEDPVEMLENPELSGCTVQEYADSQGKKLVYARLLERFDSDIINGWGMHAKTDTDGSLHIYGSGNNPSSVKKLEIRFEGFAYEPKDPGPFTDRTAFALTLEDQSTSDEVAYTQFRAWDPDAPDIEKDYGYIIDSLTMKKTELGIYATFTYHPTGELKQRIEDEIDEAQKIRYEKDETNEDGLPMEVACSPEFIRSQYLIGFIMLDEQGEYFKTAGPSGGGMGIVDNGDGTYSYTCSMAGMENTDNLKFRVLTGDMDKVGTYAFSR